MRALLVQIWQIRVYSASTLPVRRDYQPGGRRRSAMKSEAPQIEGMLLVDESGSVVFSTGAFRDGSIQSALIQKWKREGTERHQILALRAAGKELVVLSVPSEHGTLFVNTSSDVANPLFQFV